MIGRSDDQKMECTLELVVTYFCEYGLPLGSTKGEASVPGGAPAWLSFHQNEKLSAAKAERMRDMVEAVEELTAIEAGKRKPRSIKALLSGE